VARRIRQLEFDLRERARWGGRRAGAGRTCGPSPRHDHRVRERLAACSPCHVTLKVRRGIPSLRAVALVRELERSFAAACERNRFRLIQYSIQHDHLHAIVEATSERDLAAGMKSIGSRLARAVNRVFRLRGRVLADRYHLHILRTPREVRHALAYVLMNARRHLAKMGRRLPAASVDPASSGRFFSGWNRRFHPASSLLPPPVAPPHTWLLRMGWRRHGLLDPAEIPGAR
jgi:REP element-mobilizing transposase RayT